MNAFSLLPSTMSSRRAVPPFFLGVRSTMMVTYLLPNGVCRHTCSSTPISSTPSHWAQHPSVELAKLNAKPHGILHFFFHTTNETARPLHTKIGRAG